MHSYFKPKPTAAKRVALPIFVETSGFQLQQWFGITWKLLKTSCPHPSPAPKSEFLGVGPRQWCLLQGFLGDPNVKPKFRTTTLDPCWHTAKGWGQGSPSTKRWQCHRGKGISAQMGLIERGAQIRVGTHWGTWGDLLMHMVSSLVNSDNWFYYHNPSDRTVVSIQKDFMYTILAFVPQVLPLRDSDLTNPQYWVGASNQKYKPRYLGQITKSHYFDLYKWPWKKAVTVTLPSLAPKVMIIRN